MYGYLPCYVYSVMRIVLHGKMGCVYHGMVWYGMVWYVFMPRLVTVWYGTKQDMVDYNVGYGIDLDLP